MSRNFHEMSPSDQQAYRIWESYLNDRTRSPKEHELARRKMDELLWASPNAQVVELRCRVEALEVALADARDKIAFLAESLNTIADFVQMISPPTLDQPIRTYPPDDAPCCSPECCRTEGGFTDPLVFAQQPDAELTDARRPTTNPFARAAEEAVEVQPSGISFEEWVAKSPANHAVPPAGEGVPTAPAVEGDCCPGPCVPARRRGRPKGSKNKAKLEPKVAEDVLDFSPPPVEFLPAEPAPPAAQEFTDPLADLFGEV